MNTFTITSHGKKFQFDTSDWNPEVIQAHMIQGIKIRLDRSSASKTIKEGFDVNDRLKECEKAYTIISSGAMPKSGGGGSRLTPQERSLKITLQTKVTFKKGESISEALSRFTQEIAITQSKTYEKSMDEKVQSLLESTDLYKDTLKADLAKSNPVDLQNFSL